MPFQGGKDELRFKEKEEKQQHTKDSGLWQVNDGRAI
jgi:hypothetical protein